MGLEEGLKFKKKGNRTAIRSSDRSISAAANDHKSQATNIFNDFDIQPLSSAKDKAEEAVVKVSDSMYEGEFEVYGLEIPSLRTTSSQTPAADKNTAAAAETETADKQQLTQKLQKPKLKIPVVNLKEF